MAPRTTNRPANRTTVDAGAAPDGDVESLIFPIGHYVGAQYRIEEPSTLRQVRRGATFHDLSADQFAVWAAAHATLEAVENAVPWRRQSIETHPQVSAVADAGGVIDELLGLGLLVEVTPGTDQADDFARSHRLVPLMLGLGNDPDDLNMFGIGFLHQPVLSVSHAIYDLWQWSAMDDSLWATCQNAADVARRAGATDPEFIDPGTLATGLVGSLHVLLLANAAYLDVDFRLNWPTSANGARDDG